MADRESASRHATPRKRQQGADNGEAGADMVAMPGVGVTSVQALMSAGGNQAMVQLNADRGAGTARSAAGEMSRSAGASRNVQLDPADPKSGWSDEQCREEQRKFDMERIVAVANENDLFTKSQGLFAGKAAKEAHAQAKAHTTAVMAAWAKKKEEHPELQAFIDRKGKAHGEAVEGRKHASPQKMKFHDGIGDHNKGMGPVKRPPGPFRP